MSGTYLDLVAQNNVAPVTEPMNNKCKILKGDEGRHILYLMFDILVISVHLKSPSLVGASCNFPLSP